jgi:DNA-directed RNA polymerase subunit RPC12/RpoP
MAFANDLAGQNGKDNVTYGDKRRMPNIPCFLCTQELPERKDKNKKPYFICDSCGVQIFVRGRRGIQNLSQLIMILQERDFPFREHSQTLYEIQGVLTEIRGIEKEIKSLDGVLDVFFPDEYKERARFIEDAYRDFVHPP